MGCCKSLILKLRTALSLSARDWLTLVQAWGLLLLLDLALRSMPFRRVEAWVSRRFRATSADSEAIVSAQVSRAQRLVDAAARYHVYPMLCLRQALALQWLLNARGIATTLRFGVKREESGISAHAWLERDGQPIGQPHAVLADLSELKPRKLGP